MLLWWVFSDFDAIDGANWAQSSGYLEQNVVIPAMPSPAVKHWQSRYGMASVTYISNVHILYS